MKAILDQENWAEIDVPDEFQAIVTSFFSPETLVTSENATSNGPVAPGSEGSLVDAGLSNSSQNMEQHDSVAEHLDSAAQGNSSGLRRTESGNADTESNSAHSVESNSRERGKASPRMLYFNGIGYHMVNW